MYDFLLKVEMWLQPWDNPRPQTSEGERSHDKSKHEKAEKGKERV